VTRWLALAMLAALGCAQPVGIPEDALDTELVAGPNVLQSQATACVRVFTPEPLLLEATQAAAARWSAATGCDVHVGEGGWAVTLGTEADVPPIPVGSVFRGYTSQGTHTILVSTMLGLELATLTVAHEMGHALEGNGSHSVEGLMSGHARAGSPIDSASLELVCSELPCVWMRPE